MQDGWITAGFNALNQPMYIWSPTYYGTSNWMYFGYDPLGRCVKRWVGDSGDIYSNPATYFHYDGWNLLQEGANAWGPARVYVHGNRVDEVVWSYNTFTGEQAFHHYDARGHCTLLTDSVGNILEQYEYDAFGQPYFYDANGNSIGAYDPVQNLWEGYSQFGNRFLFTGREWIADLKLYDYRNRMYQPELGRFLQPDPKEFEAGDYNLYRYCHNDPVNKSDPTGMAERIMEDRQWKSACFNDSGNSFQGSWNEFSNRHQSESTSNNANAAYKPIHVNNEGNGGNRNAPDYYQAGPLTGKNGEPNDNQGQTIAETRGYKKNSDGSVTANVFIDVHVLAVHKGDSVDVREQEHPNGFKGVADAAFVATMRELPKYHSTSEIQDAKIRNFQKAFDHEKDRQRPWEMGGGRHDYSKFREWGLFLNPGSP
jgi:RHS repeat-associated protein